LSAKDDIPEPTGDSEAIFIVHEVVLKVILLQFSPVCRQRLVVQEIVSQVITDVSKDAAAEDSGCNMPIPIEDCVGQFPERGCKRDKESWRHNQPEFVHRKIVVDAVKEKVQRKCYSVIREKSEDRSQYMCM
jgi:hypothetical protein